MDEFFEDDNFENVFDEKFKNKIDDNLKKKYDNNKIQEDEDENENEEDIIYNENELTKFKNYFKKIKIKFHEELFSKDDIKYNLQESNLFFCGEINKNTGQICEKGNEICPSCMKKNQKIYGLKPHYLINSAGRVCTYRNNKLYCLCKFNRNEEKFGFEYSNIYICRPKQQCEPCRNLTKLMNRYFSQKLMNNLKKRDKIIYNS